MTTRDGGLLVALFLGATATLRGGEVRDPVLSFDLEVIDVASIEDAVDAERSVQLDLLGVPHRLFLHRTGLRSRRLVNRAGALGAERPLIPLRSRTFGGQVAGDPGSTVRLSVTGDGILGYVRSGQGWIFIEPIPRGDPLHEEGAHRVYTDADLDPTFLLPCGASVRSGAGADALETSAPVLREATTNPSIAEGATLQEMELAVDTDSEYVASCRLRNVDPTQEVEALLNLVDGIYQTELGLKLTLVHLQHWDAEPDPYSSLDSQALLNELREHWNASRATVERDAVHLLTGKDLDGGIVGLAYMDVVCNRSWAYGLSQDLPQARALMPLLLAHEIGHNLGAQHDVDTGTLRYIMYPSVGPSTLQEFSDPSRSDIAEYVAGTNCLSEVLDGTGGTSPPPPPPPDDGEVPPTDGGGGGPVDPLLALILGATALTWRRPRRGGDR